jgi:uncharacterized protein YprB with RNaseH-like and TPR domain
MLKKTFCHVPGIGAITENKLWSSGLHCWDDLIETETLPLSARRVQSMRGFLDQSTRELQDNNPHYFASLLPSNQIWRIFPEFRDSVAYVDIETTGLESWMNHITTISLYDGKSVSHYVYDQNLDDFKEDIEKYKIIVTYNGKCFDVPFLQYHLRIPMNHVQIDLRYLLHSLGYSGGLKGCEKKLGFDRGELTGIDGYDAVLLWNDFVRNDNGKALETLLAYNVQDTIIFETLMVIAYNLKLKTTPFSESHQLPLPEVPEIPFKADTETIVRIKQGIWR